MDRMACVDVAALALQRLLVQHPDWAGHPAAVVERDRPQGLILRVNQEAWRRGVRPGQRYAAGLALASGLRAGVVSAAEVAAQVAALSERLRRFSPYVEPAAGEPGIFWLSAVGLTPLYPSLAEWAEEIRRDLGAAGFQSSVVVGFTRFGTYAVARGEAGRVAVFAGAEQERRMARNVPLRHLDLDLNFRHLLDRLGVRTVGAFVDLPAGGIRSRLGRQAHRLHQLATGDLATPLQPEPAPEPVQGHTDLEWAETDVRRLLFLVRRELEALLKSLHARGEALRELVLRLELEDGGEHRVEIRPAAPTLDGRQILNLLHLRLERDGLPGGVAAIDLLMRSARATPGQLQLFGQPHSRDLKAADRALARLRAQFGDGTVVQARLRDGHLPEARFAWEPLHHTVRPVVHEVAVAPVAPEARPAMLVAPEARHAMPVAPEARPMPLVRRLYQRPRQLPRDSLRPCGGPYVVAGGWWRKPVHREYYFNETPDGELLWTYYDRQRQSWFVHGRVE